MPLLLLAGCQGGHASTTATFYVATNGNDGWSGTLAAPNASSKDGPFASLDRARRAVQALDKSHLASVTVQLRGGTYFLTEAQSFSAADSGTATTSIVYESYPGETPVLSGGTRVTNWTNTGGNVWKATLPPSAAYFEDLFYNGARRLRPRLGGDDLGQYFRVQSAVHLPQAGAPTACTKPSDCSGATPFCNTNTPRQCAPSVECEAYDAAAHGWLCFDRFHYQATDPIAATWKNLSPPTGNPCGAPAGNPNLVGDIEIVDFEQYWVSKLRVSCVDTVNHILYTTGPTTTYPQLARSEGFMPNHRYLIENVEDELKLPGQWFLDRSTTPWVLTYLSMGGENPNTDLVIVPQLPQLIVASNLQDVQLVGLSFAHANVEVPATGFVDPTTPIGAALSFQNARGITFAAGVVSQTSANGIDFLSCIDSSSPGCSASTVTTNAVNSGNVVKDSSFYDIGGTAIRFGVIGEAGYDQANSPQSNSVTNNVVTGFGRVFPSQPGISQANGHDNLYSHNEVYDGYHTAIGVGSSSDKNPLTINNTISYNHVHDLFQGLTNDDGALYLAIGGGANTDGGNKYLNNKVHDVSDATALGDTDGYGGDGLYVDDFLGQVDMENNLVYRVSGHAVDFSGARSGPGDQSRSTIVNNIFAFARVGMINAANPYTKGGTPPAPLFFTASRNLFLFDRSVASSPEFFTKSGCAFSGAGAPFTGFQQWSSNLYWRTDGGFASDAQTFYVQPNLSTANVPCIFPDQMITSPGWTLMGFAGWQALGEDAGSLVKDPGFNNPGYPADDYSLPGGSPGVGFVVFDPGQAGRTSPLLMPPRVAPSFVTATFDAKTDF